MNDSGIWGIAGYVKPEIPVHYCMDNHTVCTDKGKHRLLRLPLKSWNPENPRTCPKCKVLFELKMIEQRRSEERGMLMETTDNLKREIEKLKTAGSMQATELLKERMKIAKLRVYLKEGTIAMENCIIRKPDGTPIDEVHTQRSDERKQTYSDIWDQLKDKG